ncbi:hypothetical protein UCDDA912_g09154 [Diaporthe ampelina]|uniref:Diels-Alderase N-terminal domain-containing protein n=1 Tax=Diaporthe ampelina TaxID=1214573 RepID=A0A0G2F9M2_9PEZI|nr:hypothetical protein UCDDA912_g09154 [Diaporthe ampelina]
MHSIHLEPVSTNGTISVEHLSVAGNLDGFKMTTRAARGSADLWYFDMVSSASNQTLNIVFFNSGEFSQYPHLLSVQVSGVYANRTSVYFEALADSGVSLTNGPRWRHGCQNLLPGLYWANAVTDASTAVDLQVGETTVSFADGVG